MTHPSRPSPPPPPESPARSAALAVQRALHAAGHVAYFAGGCVRDELLGRVPSDYDVATSATPEQIERLFRRTAQVGAHFGVVLVREQEQVIEVATFRSDGSYSDARRPDSVRFSSPQEDADRRDYTVNALFLDPREGGAPPAGSPRVQAVPGGLVIDYVGGLDDLAQGVLRAVGDPEARLREDHLRALRAARLAAKLGFVIDGATARAIATHARELRGVSPERVGGEVLAMLTHPSRARAAELLRDLNLEPAIVGAHSSWLPAWRLAPGEAARTLRGLAPGASAGVGVGVGVALAAWALDLGVGSVDAGLPTHEQHARCLRAMRAALCLSNADRDAMAHALEGRLELLQRWGVLGVAQRKRLIASPRFESGVELIAATQPETAAALRSDRATLENDGIGIAPMPLITGDDLVAIGIRPGPAFKTILDTLYDGQLEGRLTSRAEALEQSRELAARLGV